MSTVKILLNNGQTTEIPEGNLENFKRLNASKIKQVLKDSPQSYDEILAEIDDEEPAVEMVNEESPREIKLNELLNSDKDVLVRLANEIAEKRGDKLFTKRNAVKTLAEYIADNQ